MANNADVVWAPWAIQAFTEQQRAAAVLPPNEPYVVIPPPIRPVAHDGLNTGTVDPAQMFADGFVYVGGRWVRPTDAAAVAASAPSGRPPGSASVVATAQVIGGGSVLGVQVPVAPAVLLPSFVGGRIGVVRRSGGLRPESGGTPRIVKGIGPRPNWMKVVRT